MADNCVFFPRKLLKKFITLYRELPCLWDRKSVAYKHKQKRHEAISKLTELVQEFDPSATRVHVLRKIESIRACVRREYKRVQDSRRKKATNPDEILYKPHLWYYDLLSFLFEAGLPHSEQNEEVEGSTNDNAEEEEPAFEQSMDTFSGNMTGAPESFTMPKMFDEDPHKTEKRHCTEIEDEYDAIGINVAAKLRSLPSNMRIVAEKLINDVLYQAQMNGLNSSSVIITTDPFKQVVI
ncbi:unnamed protein product [Parnassius mnemosyne]|uniref:MADF domain-containing protein n=1 Tax=Parnassius mnemosyne TaxID=213953 RepID=A0AAV1KNV1_9NEOP